MAFIDDVLTAAFAIQKKHGLPAAALTAQVILETGWGKSVCKDRVTGKYSYNLFNIKGTGPAGYVTVRTDEWYTDHYETITDQFRAYNNYEESFMDYVKLITGYSRYKPCLEHTDDSDEYCRQLQACGYATSPTYATNLIRVMNENKLKERVREMMGTLTEEEKEWKEKGVSRALEYGILTQLHSITEPCADYGSVCAIAANLYEAIIKKLEGK